MNTWRPLVTPVGEIASKSQQLFTRTSLAKFPEVSVNAKKNETIIVS